MLGRHPNLETWILLWLVWSTDESSEQKFMLACADQELFINLYPLQFSCSDKTLGGYYADVESSCHVFHFCGPGYKGGIADYVFCCHPELVFDQKFLVCDRPDTVDCARSVIYYSLQFRDPRSFTELENERFEKATLTTTTSTTQTTRSDVSDVEHLTRINSSTPPLITSLKLVDLLDISGSKLVGSSDISALTEVQPKQLANISRAVETSETTTILSQVQTTRNNCVKTDRPELRRTLSITFNTEEASSLEPVRNLSKSVRPEPLDNSSSKLEGNILFQLLENSKITEAVTIKTPENKATTMRSSNKADQISPEKTKDSEPSEIATVKNFVTSETGNLTNSLIAEAQIAHVTHTVTSETDVKTDSVATE